MQHWCPPITRIGHRHPCTVTVDRAVLKVAQRRTHCTYPELATATLQCRLLSTTSSGSLSAHRLQCVPLQ